MTSDFRGSLSFHKFVSLFSGLLNFEMGEVSYSDHLMCEFHKHLKLHQTESALYCFNLLLNRRGGDDKERSGLFSLLKNIIVNPFSSW